MALTAVVTGASGYLAGEVIHQLLAKGYNVRGTVTNVEDRRKTGPLVALRKALPGKLTLTEADLFEPGSFDDVVKGADFVFHTASNVIFDSSNPEVSRYQPTSSQPSLEPSECCKVANQYPIVASYTGYEEFTCCILIHIWAITYFTDFSIWVRNELFWSDSTPSSLLATNSPVVV